MSVTICHASINEKGTAKNGAAGDQTGKEVCTRSWYSKPWGFMLRYPDASIAQKAAVIAQKLANSNLVGYDQNQRNTLYTKLAAYGWDVDKYIASGVKSETDCSAFVYACYCCLIPGMRSTTNAPTTSTMKTKFKAFGFTVYTSTDYRSTDANLMIGDVLVKAGSHTVMAITNGANIAQAANIEDYTLVFDAAYYAQKYSDLAANGIRTETQLFSHFISNGMKEARQAISTFNPVTYRNRYADLDAAFGDDWEKYYLHFINNGYAEKRSAV